jgi:pimeloyl-ACP methyl ester carboxylesterase
MLGADRGLGFGLAWGIIAQATNPFQPHVLPAVGVPTLVFHRTGDRLTPQEQASYMTHRIKSAALVELSDDN